MSQVIVNDRSGRAAALARRLGLPVVQDQSDDAAAGETVGETMGEAVGEVHLPEHALPFPLPPTEPAASPVLQDSTPPYGMIADLSHHVADLQSTLSQREADLRAISQERDRLADENRRLAKFFERLDFARQGRRLWAAGSVVVLGIGLYLLNGYVLNPKLPDPAFANMQIAPGGKRPGQIAKAGAHMLRSPQDNAFEIAWLEPGAKVMVLDIVTVALEQWVVIEAVGTKGYIHRLEINLAQ